MSWRVAAARFRALFSRSRLERELDDEVRFHLEMQAESNRRSGMSPTDARNAARRSFGGVDQAKEHYRERRAVHLIETTVQDVRYALREMHKHPAFTLVAVLSLAVGIGANTAVFSFADALLLRPLPVPRPGKILTVGTIDPRAGFLTASYRDYIDVRDRSVSFEELGAYATATVGVAPDAGSTPVLRKATFASSNLFRTIEVAPQLGREFRPEEDTVPGRDSVVLLSHALWQQQYQSDPGVLGQTVRVNGIECTVIGVMPASFPGLDQFAQDELYAPLMMWPRIVPAADRSLEARDARRLTIKGRLKPAVTQQQAGGELALIGRALEQAYPDTNRDHRLVVRTELQDRISNAPPVAVFLVMLALLAAAVLLVACANVAGLLTSRAPVRARELALRLAVGASRARVVRQLVTENLILALTGSLAGLAVCYAAVRLFRTIQIPADVPVGPVFEIDQRALAVSFALSVFSTFLFGLMPALTATRSGLAAAIKSSDATDAGGRRRWGRGVLVGAQVALAVVLLVVAGYIFRGFQELVRRGPGFRTDRLLITSIDQGLRQSAARTPEQFFDLLMDDVGRVPGISRVTLTSYLPLDGAPRSVDIVPENALMPPGVESVAHASSVVDEAYFETLGIPILEGRGFLRTDAGDAPRVAVVNETFAARYWQRGEAVGKRFRVNGPGGPFVEIVGVARNSLYTFLLESPREYVYLPRRQWPSRTMFLFAESASDPAAFAQPLRDILRRLDPNLPMHGIRTMEEHYQLRGVNVLTVTTTIVGAMGLMGLTLAIVGLYGLVAYAVSRRTREIGVRYALGAARSDVLRMVLTQGMTLAMAGLAAGLLASVAAARALSAAFPGAPHGDGNIDIVAFAAVTSLVLAVTLVASYIPAHRAARISPTLALRYE